MIIDFHRCTTFNDEPFFGNRYDLARQVIHIRILLNCDQLKIERISMKSTNEFVELRFINMRNIIWYRTKIIFFVKSIMKNITLIQKQIVFLADILDK